MLLKIRKCYYEMKAEARLRCSPFYLQYGVEPVRMTLLNVNENSILWKVIECTVLRCHH